MQAKRMTIMGIKNPKMIGMSRQVVYYRLVLRQKKIKHMSMMMNLVMKKFTTVKKCIMMKRLMTTTPMKMILQKTRIQNKIRILKSKASKTK
jgi:hypothetical protein